jgi:hypothetical protein
MTSIETRNKPKQSLCLPKLPPMIRPLSEREFSSQGRALI